MQPNTRLAISMAIAVSICHLASAQSDTPLAFDVASIKQRPMPAGRTLRRPHSASGVIECANPIATELFDCGISGSRFSDSPASLLDLIMDAFNIRENALVGLPDWGDSGHDIYDVTARVGSNQTPTLDHVRQMLQTLLVDRFHLRAHRENRERPVYELVMTKPKLVKSARACAANSEPLSNDGIIPVPDRWEQIPTKISENADRPVIDKTGFDPEARYCLPGRYPVPSSLLMRTLHPPLPAAPPPREDVAAAVNELEDTWGLKLVPRKEPMDVLVIDHVERPSTK